MALNVWMLTFEATPFVKVGGLAEVPTNLCASLAGKGVSPVIVLPAHSPSIDPASETAELNAHGKIYVFEKTAHGNVSFIKVHGGFLDDPRVYADDILEGKIIDFTTAFSLLLAEKERLGLAEPDIIHFHDWHSVLPLLKAKEQRGTRAKPALIYHVHLLVRKKLDKALFEKVGLRLDWPHTVYLNGRYTELPLREVYERTNGVAERIGLAEADKLVTVSKSFLEEDLRSALGEDVLGRGTFVYNGTDWSYESLYREVLSLHGEKLRELYGSSPSRLELRRYLLLHALGNLPTGEPKLQDDRLRNYIAERVAPPLRDDLGVEAFRFDGPLLITTGRLSRQKGFDVLAEAVELLLQDLGEARVIFLVLPVWGGESYVDLLVSLSREYPGNVRVIFGVAPSIYKLAHLSADVFAAPSRWEPFGIMAVEAMAAGCPVVASRVGGLKETVTDIRKFGIKGTGLHVEPGDPYELADSLRDMLAFMEASNQGQLEKYLGKIGDRRLADLLENYIDAGEIIRKNAIDRVESYFTWEKSAEKLLAVYKEVLR
ncbi:glycosyltransferase [Infirmifilum sp. NZ]|uniref:glycosyltransferase n=1 Tax=Infirmifilum sp. NZ TaxID=2926850 RepID=UPI002DBED2F7|nr:glycosyltransferase [Infirmifilum sp. NZ]